MKDIIQSFLCGFGAVILISILFSMAYRVVDQEQRILRLETQVQIYTELMDMYFKG